MALVSGTMAGITRIITTDKFEPQQMLRMIEQYGVSFTLIAPSYLARLLQCQEIFTTNLSSLRCFLCGGSAVSPQLVDKINKLLPAYVCVAYGISEISGMVSANERSVEIPDSVGLLKEGMVVQIVNENGKRCGPETDGEIWIQSPFTFLGYWGDDKATAEAKDADGWFHTGDVGHFDKNGFLYLVDRKKDILKYRGYQISPSELENLILQCNGVAEVCVVGIPDPVSTDLPAAVVVKAIGKDVNESDINGVVKSNLNIMQKKK